MEGCFYIYHALEQLSPSARAPGESSPFRESRFLSQPVTNNFKNRTPTRSDRSVHPPGKGQAVGNWLGKASPPEGARLTPHGQGTGTQKTEYGGQGGVRKGGAEGRQKQVHTDKCQQNPTKTNHPKTMPNKDYNEARELLRPQQKWTTRRIGAATEGEVAAKMCKRDGEKEAVYVPKAQLFRSTVRYIVAHPLFT